jgi:hypothetical protein
MVIKIIIIDQIPMVIHSRSVHPQLQVFLIAQFFQICLCFIFFEERLRDFKIQNSIVSRNVNVNANDSNSICHQLFSSELKSSPIISGTYLEIFNTNYRCGYTSYSNARNNFLYMESKFENQSSKLTYYELGSNFSVVKRYDQPLLYDPMYEAWYKPSMNHSETHWSAPYINSLTKKATITLSSFIPNQISSSQINKNYCIVALDLQLDTLSILAPNGYDEVFVVEKDSYILISSKTNLSSAVNTAEVLV